MAGWAIDKARVDNFLSDREKTFENAVRLIFSKGDSNFNSPNHHGEPNFRAAMVMAGQEARLLSAQEAFKKGLKLAGLQ